uniref:Tumor necrosis factor ligand superfamily member 10 n=1 Tax=Erpetoichthys calabaricus TaxID=27687 RepID=A0A8C4X9K3_ERPCA
MANRGDQEYFRSASNDSTTYMIIPAEQRAEKPTKLWIAMVVTVVIVLQIVSTAGLFVYFTTTISQVKSQGVSEELKCLKFLNTIERDTTGQYNSDELKELFGSEPCMKLADGIRSYISKVTENIIRKQALQEARNIPRTFNTSGVQFTSEATQRPSAHLALRDTAHANHGGPHPSQTQSGDLQQSCRHTIRTWSAQSFGSHMHNMTLKDGRLKVPRDGRYYLYSQIYFRYPLETIHDHPELAISHQLVQCLYKKTSYLEPILLLKGVATKCWADDAEYALHSIYQGGLFELREGDEVFVSVSSMPIVYPDETSSYFGAFRLDL